MSKLNEFILQIKTRPESISFQQVIDIIDDCFIYTPTTFYNGTGEDKVVNNAGENQGSCKILSFALLHDLDTTQTLNCFGQYYRDDVLQHPDGDDHANIRTLMRHGMENIHFDSPALHRKQAI